MGWKSQLLYGQTKLVAQGKVSGKAIKLRLAINETTEWQGLLKAGFIIEREAILKDKQPVLPIRSRILGIIRTAELEKWESAYLQNDFAAVAAQSIFGDDLKVSLSQNELMYGMQKAEINNQRRDLVNYCAENSWETAVLSGLAFTDSTAKPKETYLY